MVEKPVPGDRFTNKLIRMPKYVADDLDEMVAQLKKGNKQMSGNRLMVEAIKSFLNGIRKRRAELEAQQKEAVSDSTRTSA